MSLRATKPEKKDKYLKILMFGPAGTGKTIAALQFPNAYIIDMEKGADCYYQTITDKNSVLFQTSDPLEVDKEIDALINESHNYKTLIIDPITIYWESIQEIWHNKFVEAQILNKKKIDILEDFGLRFWQKAKPQHKKFLKKLSDLNMNVIITAHEKDRYNGQSIIGVTYDSNKGDDYIVDFVFRFCKTGDKFKAITLKQRNDKADATFPEGKEFDWHYENLLKFVNKRLLTGDQSKTEIKIEKEPFIKNDLKKAADTLLSINNNQQSEIETNNDQPITVQTLELDYIKKQLKSEKIKIKDFIDFITDIIKWPNIKRLTNLDNEQIHIIAKDWDKVFTKYRATKNISVNEKEVATPKEEQNSVAISKDLKLLLSNIDKTNFTYQNFLDFTKKVIKWDIKTLNDLTDKHLELLNTQWKNKILPKFSEFCESTDTQSRNDQNKPKESQPEEQQLTGDITEEQKETIKQYLSEENISLDKFFSVFDLENWEGITAEGANNIITNFDSIIEEIK